MTPRTVWTLALIFMTSLAWPDSARAQLVVIDPANLAQIRNIVDTTLKHLARAIEIRDTLQRAGQKLGSMKGYRTIGIAAALHEVEHYPQGAALLQAMNGSDGRGYAAVTRGARLLPPELMAKLSPEARRVFDTAQATLDVADSVNQRSIQVLGGGQGVGRSIAKALLALEADILNPADDLHYQAASLDKINGAGLIHARQTDAVNQQLAAIVEQLLVRTHRDRDAQAVSMNRRLNALEHGPAANASLMRGAGDAVRTWSQP